MQLHPDSTAPAPARALKDPPPLRTKPLRAVFEVIEHSRLRSKSSDALARGIDSIEDAVAIAIALAERREGQSVSVMIRARITVPVVDERLSRKRSDFETRIVGCLLPGDRKAVEPFLACCKRELAKEDRNYALRDQRYAWLQQNFGRDAFEQLVLKDQPMREAWFINDFAAAWKRALDLLESGVRL